MAWRLPAAAMADTMMAGYSAAQLMVLNLVVSLTAAATSTKDLRGLPAVDFTGPDWLVRTAFKGGLRTQGASMNTEKGSGVGESSSGEEEAGEETGPQKECLGPGRCIPVLVRTWCLQASTHKLQWCYEATSDWSVLKSSIWDIKVDNSKYHQLMRDKVSSG